MWRSAAKHLNHIYKRRFISSAHLQKLQLNIWNFVFHHSSGLFSHGTFSTKLFCFLLSFLFLMYKIPRMTEWGTEKWNKLKEKQKKKLSVAVEAPDLEQRGSSPPSSSSGPRLAVHKYQTGTIPTVEETCFQLLKISDNDKKKKKRIISWWRSSERPMDTKHHDKRPQIHACRFTVLERRRAETLFESPSKKKTMTNLLQGKPRPTLYHRVALADLIHQLEEGEEASEVDSQLKIEANKWTRYRKLF